MPGNSGLPVEPVDVVLFMRKLGRVMAGGARAVLDRADLYAREGLRVTLVVVGPDATAGAATLRRRAQLDPRVRVLSFGRHAPGLEAWVEASRRQPLAPPVPLGAGVRILEEPGPRRGSLRRTWWRDATPQAVADLDDRGRLSGFTLLAQDGSPREQWRYGDDGDLLVVDRFSGAGGAPEHRTFVVGGSLRWLEVDLRLSEGRGPATGPGAVGVTAMDGGTPSFAQVIAAWLDREFRDSARLVVMADGENTAQHVLRAMRHPQVRGVSVLHNAHTVPPEGDAVDASHHAADAPVKPHWVPFLEDLTNVHAMVCLTARQRDDLLGRYPRLPLRVVHHAVPDARELEGPTGRGAAERVRRDPNRLVFVGRLASQKRLDHLVQAFAVVAARVPAARLDLYGTGGELEALQSAVTAAGLDDRVSFRGFTDDAASAFASAAAAVMTSRYEGLPLTLTEAMAVGTPFVAYDLDYGPAEVIRHGVDGLLVPSGDVAALAEALVRVLTEPGLAEALGRRAREVRDRFSPRRYAEAWLAVVDDVLAEGAAPSRELETADA